MSRRRIGRIFDGLRLQIKDNNSKRPENKIGQEEAVAKVINHKKVCFLRTDRVIKTINSVKLPSNKNPIDSSVISLCSSTPVRKMPDFIGTIMAESCTVAGGNFYSSRSCEGTKKVQVATLEYYKRKGLKVENLKPIFANSEHNIVTMLIDWLKSERGSVIMTAPTFGLFFNSFINRRVPVKLAELTKESDWKLTPEILQEILNQSPEARMFVFIDPDNPTGKSYSKEEKEALAAVFLSYNKKREEEGKPKLILFADEASRRIMLHPDKKDFFSIAAVDGMEEMTVTVSTSSKDLSPGLAICHGIGPRNFIERLLSEEDCVGVLPDILKKDRYGPSFHSQYVLKELFDGKWDKEFEKHLEDLRMIYRKNLDLITNGLNIVNDCLSEKFGEREDGYIRMVTNPDGGMQCLIQAPGVKGLKFPDGYTHKPNPSQNTIETSFDLACFLEDVAKVRILHGELCAIDGSEMMFRITISKEHIRMQEAITDISKALNQLELKHEKTSIKASYSEKLTLDLGNTNNRESNV